MWKDVGVIFELPGHVVRSRSNISSFLYSKIFFSSIFMISFTNLPVELFSEMSCHFERFNS